MSDDNVVKFPAKEPAESEDAVMLSDGRLYTKFSKALTMMMEGGARFRRRAWDPAIQFVYFQDKQELRLGDIIDVRVLKDFLPNEDIGIVFQPEFRVLELWRHVRTYEFTTRDILAHDWYVVQPEGGEVG